MTEVVKWTYQWGKNFWFLIPNNREEYGWDFFVSIKNSKDAKDWDKVEWHILSKSKWKKPEAKIVKIINLDDKPKWPKIITWIYSEHKWDFWFVDTQEWSKKWYFVFNKDNIWAKDGDMVEARVKIYKWKEEAVIIKILENTSPLIQWTFSDQWNFWFVLPDKWESTTDIFVAWQKKLWAKDWDKVMVQIIKNTWRRPEWIVRKVI